MIVIEDIYAIDVEYCSCAIFSGSARYQCTGWFRDLPDSGVNQQVVDACKQQMLANGINFCKEWKTSQTKFSPLAYTIYVRAIYDPATVRGVDAQPAWAAGRA